MNVIGLTKDEQYDVFRLVASILWLGNVDFAEKGERAEVGMVCADFFCCSTDIIQVADMAVLEFVASLLGVPPAFLKTSLEIREVSSIPLTNLLACCTNHARDANLQMETKHGMQRGTTYKVPLNYIQATATRDALAKAIYDRLFNWIVIRVNKALMVAGAESLLCIGVLDIYGFEVFKRNGFEQLCINYVSVESGVMICAEPTIALVLGQ